jgi:hypothetical protein
MPSGAPAGSLATTAGPAPPRPAALAFARSPYGASVLSGCVVLVQGSYTLLVALYNPFIIRLHNHCEARPLLPLLPLLPRLPLLPLLPLLPRLPRLPLLPLLPWPPLLPRLHVAQPLLCVARRRPRVAQPLLHWAPCCPVAPTVLAAAGAVPRHQQRPACARA